MNAQIVTVNGNDYEWTPKNGLALEAVLSLYNLIRSLAWRYLPRMRCEGYELEDIIQLGYIGAIKRAQTYDPQSKMSFMSWAKLGICHEWENICKRKYIYYYEYNERDLIDDETERRGLRKADARKAIKGLDKKQKKLLFMYLNLGMSYEEIGRVIGRAIGAVTTRLKRAVADASVLLLDISPDEAMARVKAVNLQTITTVSRATYERIHDVNKVRRAVKAKQAKQAKQPDRAA